MTTNKYTFLLPAYKIEFFQEALKSILNQTYKDFQLIIQDDCSPYDLKSIVDLYKSDKRIYYYRNEENIGGKNLIKCWNKLLGKANSEYIILASDDDVYDIHFLEEIDKLTTKYSQVNLIRTRVQRINGKNEIFQKDAIYEEYVSELEFIAQQYFNNKIQCIANFIFKTQVLKEKGGFVDFPLAWYSDYATPIIMSEQGVVNTKDCLFNFRESDINISSYINESPYKAKLKTIACINYKIWFDTYLKKFNPRNKKEVRLLNFIKRWSNYDIQFMTNASLKCLKFKDALAILRYMKVHQVGYINSFIEYLKSRIKK